MFTCSSCGYEANADSAPACSLCGTKKPTTDGARASSAKPKPKPSETDDDLAQTAKLVADEADGSAPAPAKAKGKANASATKTPRGEARTAVETTTGVLRLSKDPPPLDGAAMMLGAFVGALAGYVIAWTRLHHAPAGFMDALPVLAGALVLALVARFALASYLENTLKIEAREQFAGAGAAFIGGLFLIFTIVAFVLGGRVGDDTGTKAGPTAKLVGANGDTLIERMALLTPFSVSVRTDKFVILKSAAKQVRIPRAALSQADLDEILKTTAFTPTQVETLVSDEPLPQGGPLPPGFSQDAFLANVRDAFGVQKDTPEKPIPGRIPLVRNKTRGGSELLYIPEKAQSVSELQSALPQGVKLWIGVALGMPHESSAEQDKLMSEVIDRSRPEN